MGLPFQLRVIYFGMKKHRSKCLFRPPPSRRRFPNPTSSYHSARPSNSLLWYVPSSRYTWSSAPILFLQKQIKRHHHHLVTVGVWSPRLLTALMGTGLTQRRAPGEVDDESFICSRACSCRNKNRSTCPGNRNGNPLDCERGVVRHVRGRWTRERSAQ
jgi:hypothetical protein